MIFSHADTTTVTGARESKEEVEVQERQLDMPLMQSL